MQDRGEGIGQLGPLVQVGLTKKIDTYEHTVDCYVGNRSGITRDVLVGLSRY